MNCYNCTLSSNNIIEIIGMGIVGTATLEFIKRFYPNNKI